MFIQTLIYKYLFDLQGMCCQWGNGSYIVTTVNNVVLATGAEFGESESTEFTLPSAARV